MMVHSSSLFTNPYAIQVLRTKKEELVEGTKDPDHLLHWLIENGIFTPEKRMVMSFYRTRTEKNSQVLDILISQGERACRLFFYPCLKQVDPRLYSKIRKYVGEVNESIGDARRQLIEYLLEKDKVWLENSREQHQGNKDRPHKWATKKKGKETQLPRRAKPRGDGAALDVLAAVAKGSLSELENTLNITALNSTRETLLHVAAAHGHPLTVEYLISKGAKTGLKDGKGRTALHRAAERGHGDAVKVLLRGGASVHSLDTEGKTPLHLAAENNHSHILKMLLKEEARRCRNRHSFLQVAALKGESSLAKMLLEAGAPPDEKNKRGQTALSYAVSQGSESTAKTLLEAGASVDSNTVERAFNSNHPSIFKILLEYSKDLSSETMESALFRAAQKNLPDIVVLRLQQSLTIIFPSIFHATICFNLLF